MSRDAREERIHEFLDDRMDAREREEFERALAADAELARRVEFYRQAGAALREDPPPLGPGFYARLRARSDAGARRERRLRPWAWEVAGLVAALALAGVLFVPGLVRERGTVPSVAPPASLREESPAAPPGEIVRPGSEGEGAAIGDRGGRGPEESRPQAAAVEDSAGVGPPGSGEAGAAGKVAATAPAPRPRAAEKRAPPERAQPEPLQPERAQPEPEREPRALGRASVRPSATGLLAGVRLPPGLVPAGGVVVRSGAEVAQEPEGSVEREVAARLGGIEPDERLLLVGPRERGVDCSRARLLATGEGYELRLPPAEGTPSAGGCAYRLPDDGRPVRVVEAP